MAFPPRDRRASPAVHRRESHAERGGTDSRPARPSLSAVPQRAQPSQPRLTLATAAPANAVGQLAISSDAELLSLSGQRRELLCSVIGLTVKLGLVAVAGVSLIRLAGTYQQRMERQGEINAVLELQSARLSRARNRFDQLFMTEGEQRLIREQSQWIAPNRMRVVWQDHSSASSVETANVSGITGRPAPRSQPR